MRMRWLVWVVVVLLVAAVVALVVPGSPVHLAGFLGADGRSVDGGTLGHWERELNNPDNQVRVKAIETIGKFGSDAGDAVPAVARLLTDDPDDDIRVAASVALSKMAPHTKAVVPALTQALTDKHPQVRQNTINALIRLRTDARAAVPALIATMKDPENDTNARVFGNTIQEGAASALGYVSQGTADAVPALTDVLTGDSKDGLKQAAARALGLIGSPAKPAVPALYELLKHKHRHVREEANIALRALGEDIEPFKLSAEDLKQDKMNTARSNFQKGPAKDGAKDSPAKKP